jgi:hypothetical protein
LMRLATLARWMGGGGLGTSLLSMEERSIFGGAAGGQRGERFLLRYSVRGGHWVAVGGGSAAGKPANDGGQGYSRFVKRNTKRGVGFNCN